MIPAGTGFRTFQESEVRYRPEALQAMAAEKDRRLVSSFPLLEAAGDDANGAGQTAALAKGTDGGNALDKLLRSGDK